MKSLFVKAWDPMTRKMFGSKSGFQNVFYPKKKGEFRMDIVACPYVKYFTALGCPELTKIFCANDDRCYGNLPGLEFRRCRTDFADIQNKKECGGNIQWQNNYLRNWAEDTKDKRII